MSADSRNEQQDIESLLLTMEELECIAVLSSYRGTTEAEVDAALAGALVKSGKSAGAVVLVLAPGEQGDGTQPTTVTRTHLIRVIESVKVNTRPDGTLACGLNADEIKDLVIQRLHLRGLGRASLIVAKVEQYEDARGGFGYDVSLTIKAVLATEKRGAKPAASLAGTTLTLTGGSHTGEVILYTTDGTAPVRGGATVRTYGAPFEVESGQRIRAATYADDYALSDITQLFIT